MSKGEPLNEDEREYRARKMNTRGLTIGIVVHTITTFLGSLHYWWCWGQKYFTPCDECTIPEQTYYSYSLILSNVLMFSAMLVNLAKEKEERRGKITSILAILSFCFGIYYIVGSFVGVSGKAVREASDTDLQLKFRTSFKLGQFAFYGWGVFALVSSLIPTFMGGLFTPKHLREEKEAPSEDSEESEDEEKDKD